MGERGIEADPECEGGGRMAGGDLARKTGLTRMEITGLIYRHIWANSQVVVSA